MPRMRVGLPDHHEIGKELAAVRRRKRTAASRRYTVELAAEVGAPSPRERAHADRLAQRIAGHAKRNAE